MSNSYIFIQENAFENIVCRMAAILSRPQYVKPYNLTHCALGATQIWVNIGWGNGLLPDGTKPLPEPMLTYRQISPMTLRALYKKIWRYQSMKQDWR